MADWVELRGWVDDDELADLRARARAMAFPTLAEGFGLPILEAMVEGLPVLASDLPGAARGRRRRGPVVRPPRPGVDRRRAAHWSATRPEMLPALAAAGLEQARALQLGARGARRPSTSSTGPRRRRLTGSGSAPEVVVAAPGDAGAVSDGVRAWGSTARPCRRDVQRRRAARAARGQPARPSARPPRRSSAGPGRTCCRPPAPSRTRSSRGGGRRSRRRGPAAAARRPRPCRAPARGRG